MQSSEMDLSMLMGFGGWLADLKTMQEGFSRYNHSDYFSMTLVIYFSILGRLVEFVFFVYFALNLF